MKKIIAAVMSISLALCMASCGGESVSSADKKAGIATEKKTEISIKGQAAKQSPSHPEIMVTQSETETSQQANAVPETTEETSAVPETTEGTTTTTKATTTSSETAVQSKATAATTTKPTQTTTAPESIDTTDTSSKLYYFPDTTNLRDKNKNIVGTIDAGSFYSGHYDPNYPGFVVIKHRYREYLTASSCVIEQKGAKILETAAIGQMGGDIYGKKACGPTTATILANYQLGMKWTKDELITYCEQNKLNDQGSLTNGGGITAPNLMKLIESYSGGTVKASDHYGADSAAILKSLIDSGERSIVVSSYRSGRIVAQPDSPAHFVVICGYEYIGGELYFYYADPYFGNGGRSLMRVSAQTLAASMELVTKEPRCIITIAKNT